MSDDSDIVIEAHLYYFSFGFGHHMGPKRISLNKCYTIIPARGPSEASKKMWDARDNKWSHIYDSAEAIGVERHGLKLIPFDQLLPQEGGTE